MPVTIRSATPDDLPALLSIEQQAAQAAHWTIGHYQARFADGVMLVGEKKDEEKGIIVGFVCARDIADEWEIENIVVAENVRRLGVGDALLNALLQRVREKANAAVRLEVRESNEAARRLYEKHGFHESGRRREYYKNPAEDAVLYDFRATEIIVSQAR
jgi:ribosomal-protein-alanine N-acetyltransferase